MFNACQSKKADTERDAQKSKSSSASFDQLIADTYKVGKKIGSGSYGQIRVGTNVQTGQTIAIKLEEISTSDPQLKMEHKTYQLLKGKKGFPLIYHFGRYMDHYVLVMEMLGRNLDGVFDFCGRKFTLKSMIYLTLQLLKRFEVIHQCNILYRDVKPENFMLGAKTNTVFVIDFGLSKSFVDSAKRHIVFRKTHELIGTSRYMSINAHLCKEQSRRDDLEALAYVFIYFLRGSLPWSGLKAASTKEHNQMICDLKRDFPEEELCKGFPLEFRNYLQYVRHLEFEEEPDYPKLQLLFRRLFKRQNLIDDGVYDWNC